MIAEATQPPAQPPGTFGASSEQFLASKAKVRALIGGRGSSKTYTVIDDACRHIYHNPGAKVILARQIDDSNRESTIPTLLRWFEDHGPHYTVAGSGGLFKIWDGGIRVRVPSRKAIEALIEAAPTLRSRSEIAIWVQNVGARLCGMIEHRGLANAITGGKLRGMECSFLAFVEADQIEERFFKLGFACLRQKGTDPESCTELGFIRDTSIVIDTNPPGTRHWIAEMEKRETAKPPGESIMEFWHIPTSENEHNLPENYIRDMILLPYEDNPAMLDRMLYGKYADAFEGRGVFHSFRKDRHEAETLGWPKGATLVVGMDVGVLNASIISAFVTSKGREHWWVLREIVMDGSNTDSQCVELLKTLANEFPWWNTGAEMCPQTLFYCDPAAASRTGHTKATASATTVMATHGIYPGTKMSERGLTPTLAVMNRMLQQHYTNDAGQTVWQFKIDTTRCPKLANAFRGEYRYPNSGEPGHGNDQPLKGQYCNDADHPVDSLRYSMLNCLTIAKEAHSSAMTSANREPSRDIEPARTI